MRATTPMDTSRVVELDVLLGKRGPQNDRAVRLKDLSTFVEQSIAFGLKKTREGRHFSETLASDATLPTASTWIDGPSVDLPSGAWNIQATVLVKTSVAGTIAARIFDEIAGLFAAQSSHPATTDYFTTITLSGVVVLASAKTITLQATPSVSSATIFMMSQSTIGGALDATRISAVQIGA